jgi:hypothetical protein
LTIGLSRSGIMDGTQPKNLPGSASILRLRCGVAYWQEFTSIIKIELKR